MSDKTNPPPHQTTQHRHGGSPTETFWAYAYQTYFGHNAFISKVIKNYVKAKSLVHE